MATVPQDEVRVTVGVDTHEDVHVAVAFAREEIAARARSGISHLRRSVAPTGGMPVTVCDATTIEVWVDGEPRRRLADADQEVLDSCLAFMAAGAHVRLVTGDGGLHIRASAAGVRVVSMPDRYLRRRPLGGA